MSPTGVVRTAREVALTAGAVLGVLCLVLTLAGMSLGVRPLVFQSGSMSPTIATGDLALSRTVAASELRTGDVVSVLNSGGTRVTHRVVNIAAQGDLRQLTLKGDANKQPDAEVYTVTEAQRVLFHLPRLGYVVGWFTGPVGIFLLGLYAALLLSVVFGRGRRGGAAPPPATGRRTKPRRRAPPARRKLSAALALAVVGGSTMWPSLAWGALWTDDVNVTGTSYSASTVPAPATFTCSGLGVLTVTFNWTAVSGATNYTLHYGSGGADTISVSGTNKTILTLIAGGTAWVQANVNYGSVTWASVPSATRSYSVFALAVSTCT